MIRQGPPTAPIEPVNQRGSESGVHTLGDVLPQGAGRSRLGDYFVEHTRAAWSRQGETMSKRKPSRQPQGSPSARGLEPNAAGVDIGATEI